MYALNIFGESRGVFEKNSFNATMGGVFLPKYSFNSATGFGVFIPCNAA